MYIGGVVNQEKQHLFSTSLLCSPTPFLSKLYFSTGRIAAETPLKRKGCKTEKSKMPHPQRLSYLPETQKYLVLPSRGCASATGSLGGSFARRGGGPPGVPRASARAFATGCA